MGSLFVVLVADVVFSPAGSLCLSSPVFLACLACTSFSDCLGLLLGRGSVPELWLGYSTRRGQGDGSGMCLWEENLGSWAIQLAGESLICSYDWYGLHLSSGSPPELGAGA